MTAEIVIDALTMAWFRKKPGPGLIHHSDRGSQGEFNQSLQHLSHGGVEWDDRRGGKKNGQGER
jgi:putative transposase